MTQAQINCFLSLGRTLNIAETAKQLYYTSQNVSKSIASLEEELGLSLFERDPQGKILSLTAAGKSCVDALTHNQQRFSRTLGEIHGYYKSIGSRLRIGISEWIDPYCIELANLLIGFRTENPGLRFEMLFAGNEVLSEKLESGELDMILASAGQILPGFRFDGIAIAKEHIAVVVPESVCGTESEGTFDPYCWGVPYIQSLVKGWGRAESEQVIRKELAALGLFPRELKILPNVSSLSANLLLTHCLTVTDSRFGYTPRLPRLHYYPLEHITDAYLLCMWSLKNENPRVQDFVRYARNALGDEEILPKVNYSESG